MTMRKIAEAIPHENRVQILVEWLPVAKASMGDDAFKMLYEAFYVYIDPNGIRKDNCPICLQNVLENWKKLSPYLVDAEKEYNALEQI